MAVLNPVLRNEIITGSTIVQVAPLGDRAYKDYPGDESQFRTVGNHNAPTLTDNSTETDLTKATRPTISVRSDLNYDIEVPDLENFNGERLAGLFNNNNGYTATRGSAVSTGDTTMGETASTQEVTVATGVTYNAQQLLRLRFQPTTWTMPANDLIASVTRVASGTTTVNTLTEGTDYNVVEYQDQYFLALAADGVSTTGDMLTITFEHFDYGYESFELVDTGVSGVAKQFQLRLINEEQLADGRIRKIIQLFPQATITSRLVFAGTDAANPMTYAITFNATPRPGEGLSITKVFNVPGTDSWASSLATNGVFRQDLPSDF